MGVEIRRDAIQAACIARGRDPLVYVKEDLIFNVGDANDYTPVRDYDIVIMLAVLHKLKNPTAACARLVAHALDLVVIRLPPEHAPTIIDERSGMEPHHIGLVMERSGFVLEHSGLDGPFGEWVGYYRRIKA